MLYELTKMLKDKGQVTIADLKSINEKLKPFNAKKELSNPTNDIKVNIFDQSMQILSDTLEKAA